MTLAMTLENPSVIKRHRALTWAFAQVGVTSPCKRDDLKTGSRDTDDTWAVTPDPSPVSPCSAKELGHTESHGLYTDCMT